MKRPDGTEVVAPQTTLRAATLARARAELALGVREDDGPNRDKAGRIALYRAGCVRGGRFLYPGRAAADSRDPWCAGFVSWCVWLADQGPDGPGEDALAILPVRYLDGASWKEPGQWVRSPPIGYRASVAELCADARATGALHIIGDAYVPQLGDLAVYGRDGQNPLHGGLGHVGVATGEGTVICGNDRDAVRESGIDRGPGMPLLAWISLEGAQ